LQDHFEYTILFNPHTLPGNGHLTKEKMETQDHPTGPWNHKTTKFWCGRIVVPFLEAAFIQWSMEILRWYLAGFRRWQCCDRWFMSVAATQFVSDGVCVFHSWQLCSIPEFDEGRG
jgi:hypothetical protein